MTACFFPEGEETSKVVEWDSEALQSIEEIRVEGLEVVRDFDLLSGSFGCTDFERE
jgi:hypothetical protein